MCRAWAISPCSFWLKVECLAFHCQWSSKRHHFLHTAIEVSNVCFHLSQVSHLIMFIETWYLCNCVTWMITEEESMQLPKCMKCISCPVSRLVMDALDVLKCWSSKSITRKSVSTSKILLLQYATKIKREPECRLNMSDMSDQEASLQKAMADTQDTIIIHNRSNMDIETNMQVELDLQHSRAFKMRRLVLLSIDLHLRLERKTQRKDVSVKS